jgi:hypothetical protein
MADKQALNATFFAFRRREKAVLLPATIVFAVLAAAMFIVFGLLNWQAFVDYLNWAASLSANAPKPGAPASVEQMMPPQSVMGLMPAYFLFLLAYYILLAAYEAACLRWMIHGETGGLFGLSLGADTWRVYFTYWIWFLLLILFYFVCALTIGGAVVSMIAVGQGGAEPSASMALVPLILGVVILVAVIYFGVRLAPAAATSIARRRFAFFDAWKVSQGRFWALFGAFLLLFVMFFVFYMIVAFGMAAAMGSMAMSQVGQPEPQSAEEAFRAFANPAWAGIVIGFILVMTVASFLLYLAMFGVNARAAQAALQEGKITAAA